ncbi:MAG: transcription antitermination factor NusB [Chromatiaceae bacterium]|jgi:N utilization substance protein B|nr:transcription antitermination factor NusB [Chromatiaceae bacterium]
MSGARSQARRYAVLALYQWQLTGQSPVEIGQHFFDDPAWMDEIAESLAEMAEDTQTRTGRSGGYDRGLFTQILRGVPEHLAEIDRVLAPALDRPLEQVDPVERAILRAGAFELLQCPAIPARVAINEAVELAKLFGAEQGHKYVNGVLDQIARAARPDEVRGGAVPGP